MSRPFLWEALSDNGSPGEARYSAVLAAIRRGAGSEPGAAPGLWPHYVTLDAAGRLTRELRSEHVCLVTYAYHQQGERYAVHRRDVGLGEALRQLRISDRFSEAAIDAHVAQLATSEQLAETAHHLRSLVHRMKASKARIAFDYTKLYRDLVQLQDELAAPRVRRRWGAAYYSTTSEE